MATLTPTLTLVSTDATSDALSITVTDSLTVTTPTVGLSRATITTADNQEIVDNDLNGQIYVYIKNLDGTNYVKLQNTASQEWGQLKAGEFAFFPLIHGAGLEVRADTASCNIEYTYWTAG